MSKSEREIAIFKQFLESRGLGAQAGLVESRPSPEPHILFNGVAFELVEICAEEPQSPVSQNLRGLATPQRPCQNEID